MKRAWRLAAAFLRRDVLIDYSYRGSFFFNLMGALFALWSIYFLGRTFGSASPMLHVSGGDYFRFALVGIAISVPLRGSMGGVTRRVRELQLMGGLESLVASPIAPFSAILLIAIYPLISSVLRGSILFFLGMLFFGARFPGASSAGALAALFLGMCSYLAFGIISAALVIVFKRGDPVAWAVDALTFLVSGIFYPVEVLPPPLRVISSLLPATHTLTALRKSLLQGASMGALSHELVILVIFAGMLLLLAAAVLRIALIKAAKDGSLGQV